MEANTSVDSNEVMFRNWASKKPQGVFQLNGNLKINPNKFGFFTGIFVTFKRTLEELPNKMIHRPYQKRNN